MDKSTQLSRAPERRQEGLNYPPRFEAELASLAAESDLALLLVEGRQPPQLLTSNNNSICQAFQSSTAHAHLCDPYCGEAHKRAHESGDARRYRCHAGLNCHAVPVELGKGDRLAVIAGRAFVSTKDYSDLTERFRAGDLRDLLGDDLLSNVLFASGPEIEALARRVKDCAEEIAARQKSERKAAEAVQPALVEDDENADPAADGDAEIFPPGIGLEEACQRALDAVADRHGLHALSLYLRREDVLTPVCATGRFKVGAPQLSLRRNGRDKGAPRGGRREAANRHAATNGRESALGSPFLFDATEVSEVFPLTVAEEIRGALAVAGPLGEDARRRIGEYCERIAVPLELLRLREELERRMRVAYHLQAFTEQVNSVEPDEAYNAILRHSTELLRSERASLLLYDETANELQVKAAVGPRAKAAREARMQLGEGVAGSVLREGRPLVVRDLASAGQPPAPAERKYKTTSFISYPLLVAGRKVGVLNMTDKAGGGAYDDLDLNLLDTLAPQMALALDRAEWHQKATQFQLLSITDALTGLLNRRYLEERLGEELERSKRHRFPMSFLMLDIDNFKEYNDRFGHPAGDIALEMTAQCLKTALRTADVASRYGGEEFSVLLPQTSLSEAHIIAERIRHRVENTAFPHRESQPGGAITVSIGISSFGPRVDTPESIIGAADQALYHAKSRGKNRIEAYAPPSAQNPS